MPDYIVPPPLDVSNVADEVETTLPSETQCDLDDMTPDSEVGCEKVETDDFEQDGNIFTLLFD